MKRDGLFHEFRTLLTEMIAAKRELTEAYRLAKTRMDLANAIEGGLAVRAAPSRTPLIQRSRSSAATSWASWCPT